MELVLELLVVCEAWPWLRCLVINVSYPLALDLEVRPSMGLMAFSIIGDMPSLKASLILFLSLYDRDLSFGDMSLSFHELDISLDEIPLSFLDLDLSVDRTVLSFLDPDRLNPVGDRSPLLIIGSSNLGELSIKASLKLWLARLFSIEEMDDIDFRISLWNKRRDCLRLSKNSSFWLSLEDTISLRIKGGACSEVAVSGETSERGRP
jgi:hypothetical protein